MSSHREAPEISKDPVADSTDVYAFVSPDRPDTVTLIANYIPLQKPDGGPNFYEFGDDVRYEIHVSNRGTAESDIVYRFRFRTDRFFAGGKQDAAEPADGKPAEFAKQRARENAWVAREFEDGNGGLFQASEPGNAREWHDAAIAF